MQQNIILVILFILFTIVISQGPIQLQCNDITCPPHRGKCVDGHCVCFSQYATLNTGTDRSCTLVCQYEKISRWIPLLLETFLPGVGNYAYGRKVLAMSKAGIILVPFVILGLGLLLKNNQLTTLFHEVFTNIAIGALIVFSIMEVCDALFYGLGWYVDQNGIPFK